MKICTLYRINPAVLGLLAGSATSALGAPNTAQDLVVIEVVRAGEKLTLTGPAAPWEHLRPLLHRGGDLPDEVLVWLPYRVKGWYSETTAGLPAQTRAQPLVSDDLARISKDLSDWGRCALVAGQYIAGLGQEHTGGLLNAACDIAALAEAQSGLAAMGHVLEDIAMRSAPFEYTEGRHRGDLR